MTIKMPLWTGSDLLPMSCGMDWDQELDALGLLCPMPVLKARKRLASMAEGAVLRVLADDPAAVVDVPHFCAEGGHALIAKAEEGPAQVYLIRKGG